MTSVPVVRQLAKGIGFTEGPLWTSRGELVLVSMSRGRVYQLDLASGEVVREWETGGGPNGLAEDAHGTIWVAQNGSSPVRPSGRPVGPGLQAIDGDVVSDRLMTGCAAPNDLVAGPDGLIWFTDPKPLPGAPAGRVCTYDPVTSELRTRIEGIDFPNGLAFGPDPAELYIADSAAHVIRRYVIGPDNADDQGVWAELPGGSPDGIAFDTDGRLLVAAFEHDEVLVFSPEGQAERSIPTGPGSRPTNLCFAGEDLSVLVITVASGGRVLTVDEEFHGRLPSPWISRG
ncbi:MAG TPA: SMP-30/gluconolactonase/LRE family protein [Streptosporangiaceae bacterium]|nr:SMP-30/gluconolactonase/LRE family protein [Streptosporangiaceae bacterium]